MKKFFFVLLFSFVSLGLVNTVALGSSMIQDPNQLCVEGSNISDIVRGMCNTRPLDVAWNYYYCTENDWFRRYDSENLCMNAAGNIYKCMVLGDCDDPLPEEDCHRVGDDCCVDSGVRYCLGGLDCHEATKKCIDPPTGCGEYDQVCCSGPALTSLGQCNQGTCVNGYCIPTTGCGRVGVGCCSPQQGDGRTQDWCYNGQGICYKASCFLEEDIAEFCGGADEPCCDPPDPDRCRTLTLYCAVDGYCRPKGLEDEYPPDPDREQIRRLFDSNRRADRIDGPPPPEFEGNVAGMVDTIIGYLFPIAGLIALFFIIQGGYMWIVSAGDPNRVKQAQGTLTWAIIGLVVVMVIFGVIRVILNFLA